MSAPVVAGLVPLSTVDWPGALVATVFLQGCPWRCTFCHNEAILDPRAPGAVEWSAVQDLLSRREGLLDGVVFTGGEPTMQTALEDAVREVKERGFRVGLHTGGAYPGRLRRIAGALDWVGLDLKGPPELYANTVQVGKPGAVGQAWQRFEESYRILAEAGLSMEVRTTLTPALAPHAGRIVDTLAGLATLTPHAGGQDTALVLQQARAMGAPASFAETLPEKRTWDAQFAAAVAEAREAGARSGVKVSSR